MEREDATKALATIKEALVLDPTHKGAIQARHDIYSYNEFYEESFEFDASIKEIAYASEQNLLALVVGNQVKIMTKEGDNLITLPHAMAVESVAFSPNGQTILTGSQDGNAYLWTTDGRPIQTLSTTNGWVNTVTFSPDGISLLTGHQDGTINLSLIHI